MVLSLPILDGTKIVTGLQSKVKVERDLQGIPTISGKSREDVAYTTGYIQAQDRFFQMDLLRRSANGSLADLVGRSMINVDRDHRIHQFSILAHQAFINLPDSDRTILKSYTAGVNAGLNALSVRPFEYIVLDAKPKPWSPEDSLLVIYSMYFQLQESQLHRQFSLDWLHDNTDNDSLRVLFPQYSRWDAPLDDLIPSNSSQSLIKSRSPSWFGKAYQDKSSDIPFGTGVGSSNWAISGTRTTNGSAIIANDMHLGLSLPNIWYRAVIRYSDSQGTVKTIAGIMLPGNPAIVAGSNGKVAWGFTNSYGDDLDLVKLEINANNKNMYKTPSGWGSIVYHDEVLQINHGKNETIRVGETQYGPLWIKGNNWYAIRWVAHDEGAVNLGLLHMESVNNVSEGLSVGEMAGIPEQNILVGDKSGNIGWTIGGAMPKRKTSFMDMFPYSSNNLNKGWVALLEPQKHPSIENPKSGQLWTANSMQLAGNDYALIGNGGADMGARAQQIRDDLARIKILNVKAAYNISLDDRAVFMSTWRTRALKVLDDNALKGHAERVEFKNLLLKNWTGRASIDSVGYRLSREFLYSLYNEMFSRLDKTLQVYDKKSSFAKANPRWPTVIANLLDQQPIGWLPNGSKKWRDVELAAIDDAIKNLSKTSTGLKNATWGVRNRAEIYHPLATALPILSILLSAPHDELPGDGNMPRVSAPSFGQSERMVISPGYESSSIFNMPGGVSGNPFSSYFLSGHEAWVKGLPTPFLPGLKNHTFTLVPEGYPNKGM